MTTPAHVAAALRRVAPLCDPEQQRVFPLDPQLARAPVVFGDSRMRLVQICPVAETATTTVR